MQTTRTCAASRRGARIAKIMPACAAAAATGGSGGGYAQPLRQEYADREDALRTEIAFLKAAETQDKREQALVAKLNCRQTCARSSSGKQPCMRRLRGWRRRMHSRRWDCLHRCSSWSDIWLRAAIRACGAWARINCNSSSSSNGIDAWHVLWVRSMFCVVTSRHQADH